jgi:hypothetical protein
MNQQKVNVIMRGRGLATVWVMKSRPVMYRVLPKCACSSIGAAIAYAETGKFPTDSVHDLSADMPFIRQAKGPDRERVLEKIADPNFYFFTMARNPFRRVLSCYLDKILGFQSNGKKYFNGLYHDVLLNYGMEFGARADLFEGFRIFTKFVDDTIKGTLPVVPDIHWNTCSAHLKYTQWQLPDTRYSFIGHTERLAADLPRVLRGAGVADDFIPADIPRENSTSIANVDIGKYFSDEIVSRIKKTFADDFRLFNYSDDPLVSKPLGDVDLDAVHHFLTSK